MLPLNSAIYPLEIKQLERGSATSSTSFALHIESFTPQQQPEQSCGAQEGYYLVVGGVQWDGSLYVEGFSIDPLQDGETCNINQTTPHLKRVFFSLWQGDVDKMEAVAGMTVNPQVQAAVFAGEGILARLDYKIA